MTQVNSSEKKRTSFSLDIFLSKSSQGYNFRLKKFQVYGGYGEHPKNALNFEAFEEPLGIFAPFLSEILTDDDAQLNLKLSSKLLHFLCSESYKLQSRLEINTGLPFCFLTIE